MNILFTDSHPRRIAEATRTDDLQPALDDIIQTLQHAAQMFDSQSRIAINYKQPPADHHVAMAEWAALSQSNWRHLSNISSMLLFEIAFRTDRRRRKKKNSNIIASDRDFNQYKKAVSWTATDVPINLPENGFFNVPFVLDPFYEKIGMNGVDYYRAAYVDKGIETGDLDDRSIPKWYMLTLKSLIDRRQKMLKEHK